MNLLVHVILNTIPLEPVRLSLWTYPRVAECLFVCRTYAMNTNSGPPQIKKLPYRTFLRSANEKTFDTKKKSWKDDFRAGFVATMPLWLGVAPFGAIYAVSALSAGLSPAQTLAMSLFVFAGASQFTAVGL